MSAMLDAITQGMARGVVAVMTLGLIVWALDKAFGRRP